MTEHLHYITHTHRAGDGINTTFTCTGDRTSPCHQYPPGDAEMETWGEADQDMFVAHDDQGVFVAHDECWLEPWMVDPQCAVLCGPDGEPVRSGPINVTWDGDCVVWEYAQEATS